MSDVIETKASAEPTPPTADNGESGPGGTANGNGSTDGEETEGNRARDKLDELEKRDHPFG